MICMVVMHWNNFDTNGYTADVSCKTLLWSLSPHPSSHKLFDSVYRILSVTTGKKSLQDRSLVVFFSQTDTWFLLRLCRSFRELSGLLRFVSPVVRGWKTGSRSHISSVLHIKETRPSSSHAVTTIMEIWSCMWKAVKEIVRLLLGPHFHFN